MTFKPATYASKRPLGGAWAWKPEGAHGGGARGSALGRGLRGRDCADAACVCCHSSTRRRSIESRRAAAIMHGSLPASAPQLPQHERQGNARKSHEDAVCIDRLPELQRS
jgi:hypothetical protein